MLILQAIPGMLLALVLCFDHEKYRDMDVSSGISSSKQHKYIWYALSGYAVGLMTALAAGILSQSPQPALLYLVSFFHMRYQLFSSVFNFSFVDKPVPSCSMHMLLLLQVFSV